MTVVVAYKSEHCYGGKFPVPALIGDCVISERKEERIDGEKRIIYKRLIKKYKKIYRISPNFVLGVSGCKCQITAFMKAIYGHFIKSHSCTTDDICTNAISKSELEDFFVTYLHLQSCCHLEPCPDPNFQAIGWLCEGDDVFFISYTPMRYATHEICLFSGINDDKFKGSRIIGAIGSGAQYLDQVDKLEIVSSKDCQTSPDAMVTVEAVIKGGVSLMFEHEKTSTDGTYITERLDESFGFAYEILYLDLKSREFHYVNDMDYSHFSYDSCAKKIEEKPFVYRYINCGEHLSVFIKYVFDKSGQLNNQEDFDLQTFYKISKGKPSSADCKKRINGESEYHIALIEFKGKDHQPFSQPFLFSTASFETLESDIHDIYGEVLLKYKKLKAQLEHNLRAQ